MKKAVAPPILVLLAILVVAICHGSVTSKNTDRWCDQLQETVRFIQADDWHHVGGLLTESYADWSEHQTYFHIVATHDTLLEAESMYQRALAFAATQEPSELLAELMGLQAQLRALAAREQFSIRNIL